MMCLIEVGKKYPLKDIKGDALVHRRAKPEEHALILNKETFFWVRIHLIQFQGLFFLYHGNGKYVDSPCGPPDLICGEEEEEFKIEEPEEIFDLGEEEFVI